MATDYFIYTEAKIKDKWYLISGMVPKIMGDGTVVYKQSETYWNGSRSYFGEAYDKLRDIGAYGKFKDMSDGIKSDYPNAVKAEEEGKTIYEDVIFVKYNDFSRYASTKEHDSHGVVHKNTIFMFENGDLEEMYGVEHEELDGLSDEERKQYVYHEWDDPMGWLTYFKRIFSRVNIEINKFEDMNCWPDVQEYRIVVVRC